MPDKKTVILVDKNLFFSTKVSANLRRMGYSVEVESTFEGVKNKAGPETDAVILNLSAPGLDAMEIIKNLKRAPETSRIPLIGFGGHKEQGLFQVALDLGCDRVITNSAIASDLHALLGQAEKS